MVDAQPKARPEGLTIQIDPATPTPDEVQESKRKKPKRKDNEQGTDATGEEQDAEGQPKKKQKTKAQRSKPDSKPDSKGPKPNLLPPKAAKRSQARPHRRLETETIIARLEKLKKRIARTSTQLEDATRHAEGYEREMTFRKDEPQAPEQNPPTQDDPAHVKKPAKSADVQDIQSTFIGA